MSYPVGTICIGQNHVLNVERNGMQCVIIGSIALTDWKASDGSQGTSYLYQVEWADGEISASEHYNLKRKDLFTKEELSAINTRLYPKDREKVSAVISAALKEAKKAIADGEKV